MSPDEATRATLETIQRFNEAFNRHDVDAVMALMTPDCVFENTFPAPDGERFEGPPRCDVFRGARREGFRKARLREGLGRAARPVLLGRKCPPPPFALPMGHVSGMPPAYTGTM